MSAQSMGRALLLVLPVVCLGGCGEVTYEGGPATPTKEEIDLFKRRIRDDLKDQLNTTGLLAWHESYILMSFVEMYKATRDTFFLDKLVEHADVVLSNRDDVLGNVDEIRGKVMPSWGSTSYTDGKWHVWLVHTGMITYPMAAFARIVHGDPSLHATYGGKADEYRVKVAQAVDAHDEEWIEDGEEGYYLLAVKPGNLMPLNMMLALGRTIVELWQGGAGTRYLVRAYRLARYFKNRLHEDHSSIMNGTLAWHGSYIWSRHGPWPPWKVEDISHGAIDVDFAALAFRAGIVFDERDMRKFAATFVERVVRDDGWLSANVDGSGGIGPNKAGGRWLDLAQVDQRVWDLEHELIIGRGEDHYQIGYAKLLKWK